MKFDFTDTPKVMRRCGFVLGLFICGLWGVSLIQLIAGIRSLEYVLTYATLGSVGAAIGCVLVIAASAIYRRRRHQ
jgi:hypothetical protein